MDNSDYSRNRHNNEHLGVNKIGKNIRKSPLHQPNFSNPARQQPQPQVYNINKNDFQSIVQQLTGSPSRHSQEPLPRPPMNSPKPPSMRLQRIRPSPLTPLNINRPQMPIHHHRPPLNGSVPFNGGNLARPPPHAHYDQPRPPMGMVAPPGQPQPPPMGSGDHHNGWAAANAVESQSPISAYMRYLQHSIVDSAQGRPQIQPQYQPHPQGQGQMHPQGQGQMHGGQQQQSAGLLQYPLVPPPLPSPRMMNGPPPSLPSPRMMNGPPPLPSPRMNGPAAPPPLPPFPSPRMGGPPPLPSPTSQFLLPSPTGYLNLLSPRSPYPPLSPGYQHPPPLTPNFSFSPMANSGLFGPGSQPPPSPGMNFPLSPSFFSMSSPRWRD